MPGDVERGVAVERRRASNVRVIAAAGRARPAVELGLVDPRLALVLERLDVGVDHDPGELLGVRPWPSSRASRSALDGVADQRVDLGRAQVALVEPDVLLPVEAGVLERDLAGSRAPCSRAPVAST